MLNDRFLQILQCVALFLIVIGARFWLIEHYGSDLPFSDQWDVNSEADVLFHSIDGTLTVRDWFAPFNGHRILFTRIFSYALVTINGQWDAHVQNVANSICYTIFGCVLFLLITRRRCNVFSLFCMLIITVLFASPFGWENTIWGFQSQFYFLISFSLTAIWLLINKEVYSLGWWIGILCAICSLFSMASGLLAPLAVIGYIGIALLRDWDKKNELIRQLKPTAISCFSIIIIGILLSTKAERLDSFKAQNIFELFKALTSWLAWPWMNTWWWAILSWFSVALFLCLYVSKRLPDNSEQRFLIGASAWVCLTTGAIAYMRANIPSAPRYSDILSFGIMFNALSAWFIVYQLRAKITRVISFSLLIALLAINGLGIYKVCFNSLNNFNDNTAARLGNIYGMEKFNAAGLVATGSFPLNGADFQRVPHTNLENLASLLEHPAFSQILPVSVRKPLHIIAPQSLCSYYENFKPDIISPYPWEKLWSLPISSELTGNVSYLGLKEQGLPFLRLFIYGNFDNLRIVDSNGGQHRIIPFGDKRGDWQEAYAYCPTTQCQIEAINMVQTTGMFSEPKEMGRLSLVSILLTNNWKIFFITGCIMFVMLILLVILKEKK